jgi:hypothetical protein
MKSLSFLRPGLFLLLVTLSGALAAGVPGLPDSSLSDLDLETAENKLTLEKTLQENRRLKEEAVVLQEKLAVSEATAARLTESVAMANGEADLFRKQIGDFKLRLEALGVGASSGNTGKLEERLLEAVSGYRRAESERQKLSESLKGLTVAAADFARKTSDTDPETRLVLEAQLRRSQELLGPASPNAPAASPAVPTLTDGTVISIKDELGLVVANLGVKQGVAVGMPFQVIRDDHLIGTVRVVQVRDKIAGAVIQDLSSERDKIKVGDHLKIAARQ